LVPAQPPDAIETAPSEPSRFSRQSTLRDMAATRTGRLLKKLVTTQARSAASNEREAAMFANMASYLTVEKLVRMSDGKLPWPVADSIIDIANSQPLRALTRAGTAGAGTLRNRIQSMRSRNGQETPRVGNIDGS
jgi:hypothetical protein